MEFLSDIYIADSIVSMKVVDANVICHYLVDETFKINQLNTLDKSLLWEGEEPLWQNETNSLFEEIYQQTIYEAQILIKGKGNLNFCYGDLSIELNDKKKLKEVTTKILDFYGYYSSLEIWNFCQEYDFMLDIGLLLGVKPNDITDEFNRILTLNKQ
jgi:hypothetical protein|tara:strand:+ start:5 stop:475 length:471 start_codon:yes stop_codon:yes gene_type:complete